MQQNDQGKSKFPVGLSQPAQRALAAAGYLYIEQLSEVSESEIKQLHGIGPRAIDLLCHSLQKLGLSFANEKQGKDGA
jgi:DNA-directed RNA polymerase alpha subunit